MSQTTSSQLGKSVWIDDDILKRCEEPLALSCWLPERPIVVLGSSNKAESEVDVARCAKDDVAILKRYGGGGTVVLYPGCAVVSLGIWVRQHFQNRFYFQLVNQAVCDALADVSPTLAPLEQKGLSDLVWDGRKVAGTSLFRSRNYLLYQASLLIDLDLDLIERYLKYPTREPDYRQGRSHRDFLVGLSSIVPKLNAASCVAELRRLLPKHLEKHLVGECIAPQSEQFAGLLRRAEILRASPSG